MAATSHLLHAITSLLGSRPTTTTDDAQFDTMAREIGSRSEGNHESSIAQGDLPRPMLVDKPEEFVKPQRGAEEAMMVTNIRDVFLQNGYTSDDEASDCDEPMDSGRTRSSTRRANQVNQTSGDTSRNNQSRSTLEKASSENENKGTKRKKKVSGGNGSDSDPDEGNDKSRLRTDVPTSDLKEPVCSCRNDVMKCIGILPSLPIISYFRESDDSDSSLNDDLNGHTVLPAVIRNRKEGSEQC